MHHPHDQAFKAAMDASLELVATVELERVVHVPSQRIDVAYEPHGRAPELGILDRMVALGPGMFEYYARHPSLADVKACLRKRLNFEQERMLRAQRDGHALPPEPWLWILSTARPRGALETHAAVPMGGWPTGFFRARRHERMCFVVLDELPEREDTLLLRLQGRGAGLPRALAELGALPETHVLRIRVWPVMVAYRANIMEDLQRSGDMTAYQQAQAIYQQMVQDIRHEGAHDILVRLLLRRFGALPERASERIRRADTPTIERWIEQVLTARTIDDVFA